MDLLADSPAQDEVVDEAVELNNETDIEILKSDENEAMKPTDSPIPLTVDQHHYDEPGVRGATTSNDADASQKAEEQPKNPSVARNAEEVVPILVTGNHAPSEVLKIPDEPGDIPVQTEGVRNESKDLDRNLNHPIEGKPVIPETRGVWKLI